MYNKIMSFKQITYDYIKNKKSFLQLEKYVELIEEKNKVVNLTGFTGDKLWKEGVYESILALELVFKNTKGKFFLDIGAGAGFPSIPYLIVHPNIKLTIYEPIQKRVDFLKMVVKELNLHANIKKIRAEDSNEIGKFDFITARAVMKLKYLIEISHHLGKLNSEYCWIKGPKALEEIRDAKSLTKFLELKIKTNEIHVNNKTTILVSYYKTKASPNNYPRKWKNIIGK